MNGIVKFKIKKDDNISKYIQILRAFDSTLSSFKIRECIEYNEFIMEYDVTYDVVSTIESKKNKIINLFEELLKAGAILEIYIDDKLKSLEDFKDYFEKLSSKLKKNSKEKDKINKSPFVKRKIFLFVILLAIILVMIVIFSVFSFPNGILSIIKYVMESILLFDVMIILPVLYVYEDFKKNKKNKIKQIAFSLIAIFFLYLVSLNSINFGKDLLQGTREDTFYDVDVYRAGIRSTSKSFVVEAKRDDGKVFKFKIDYNTYLTLEEKKTVTIKYYENSQILLDIK